MMKTTGCLLLLAFSAAQASAQAFIRMTQPGREQNAVTTARQYLVGSTCKGCSLTLNDTMAIVYGTGAFALPVNLSPGLNTYRLKATSTEGKSVEKTINFNYNVPETPLPVSTFNITDITTYPEGNLVLQSGDAIRLRVKALPGCIAKVGETLLYEQPQAMPGTYQGTYIVKPNDPLITGTGLRVTLRKDNQETSRITGSTFSMASSIPLVVKTVGSMPYLEFGLGEDRLGGARMTILDTAVLLNVTGKVGGDYRVQLANNVTAYIPSGQTALMPPGTFPPTSLTSSWRVWGDDKYDYVSVGLSAKLPYRTKQEINPARIVLDIFGATANTNWISQLQSVKEIKNAYYEQVSDDIFRVTIDLVHAQHWGYNVYYNGNNLVVRVKRQPATPSIKGLTITVDAGHGGSNPGAMGPTGATEKDLTLLIARELQDQLVDEGAKVIMTRMTDSYVDNTYRITSNRAKDPDLLVSIHLNSAGNPIDISGTSTFYKHIGFRPLSLAIYKRMLELGLKEYGNVGNFNFALNVPTEYPNVLVETLFLSNPSDEALVLDPGFRKQMAAKIVLGIKDFLAGAIK
ncbi:N-acetylmuramoyl-L-alanine amidase [Chitinophaga horti]|uniref:N-acetylmuramoyl-L-alanine amidase n=1 Tax=Chitinophaga horti TaxID=2920382 RepID=A0ABY6J2R5_9BACT|nr:N-acetylmuramoyl-L-alanine amidase [Chitinophaga horti]UYQ92484.1 N-acetylmuramoyl-L-alanine amidase [Chitinophaga horti]